MTTGKRIASPLTLNQIEFRVKVLAENALGSSSLGPFHGRRDRGDAAATSSSISPLLSLVALFGSAGQPTARLADADGERKSFQTR